MCLDEFHWYRLDDTNAFKTVYVDHGGVPLFNNQLFEGTVSQCQENCTRWDYCAGFVHHNHGQSCQYREILDQDLFLLNDTNYDFYFKSSKNLGLFSK